MRQALTLVPRLAGRIRQRGAGSRVMHNFSWLMVEKLVGLGITTLVSIQVARYLGPSDYGTYNYVLAIAALVAPLAALGLNHIVTKELSDAPGRAGVTLGTVAVLRKSGAAVAVAVVATWFLIDPPQDGRVPLYAGLLVAAGLIGNFEFLQYWFLTTRKMNAYSSYRVGNAVLFAAIRMWQVVSGASLQAFVIVSAAEIVCGGLLTYWSYRRSRGEENAAWRFDPALAKKLLKKSWPLIISGLTAAVYLKLAIVMLAELGSPAEAGVFAVAARLSEIWYFVPTLLMTALFPTLLDYKKKSAKRYGQQLQNVLDVLCAAGTVVAIVVSAVAVPLVRILFGEQYSGAAAILVIHVWSGVFIFMRALLSKWLIIENLNIFSLVTHGFGAACSVVLNFALIPRYGATGAAVATLISYASASYVSLLFSARTRPMFAMMTKALLWPRRLPDAASYLSRLARA